MRCLNWGDNFHPIIDVLAARDGTWKFLVLAVESDIRDDDRMADIDLHDPTQFSINNPLIVTYPHARRTVRELLIHATGRREPKTFYDNPQ